MGPFHKISNHLPVVVFFSGGLRLVDVGATKKFQNNPKRITAPTLTKTRASGGGFYLTKLNRRLLPKEA